MNGYSSYDNYFGLSNGAYSMTPMMGSRNSFNPIGRIDQHPGINAPKEKSKAAKSATIGALVGLTLAAILLFKGKGKIATAFKNGKSKGLGNAFKEAGAKTKEVFNDTIHKVFKKDAAEGAQKKGVFAKAKDYFKGKFSHKVTNSQAMPTITPESVDIIPPSAIDNFPPKTGSNALPVIDVPFEAVSEA